MLVLGEILFNPKASGDSLRVKLLSLCTSSIDSAVGVRFPLGKCSIPSGVLNRIVSNRGSIPPASFIFNCGVVQW